MLAVHACSASTPQHRSRWHMTALSVRQQHAALLQAVKLHCRAPNSTLRLVGVNTHPLEHRSKAVIWQPVAVHASRLRECNADQCRSGTHNRCTSASWYKRHDTTSTLATCTALSCLYTCLPVLLQPFLTKPAIIPCAAPPARACLTPSCHSCYCTLQLALTPHTHLTPATLTENLTGDHPLLQPLLALALLNHLTLWQLPLLSLLASDTSGAQEERTGFKVLLKAASSAIQFTHSAHKAGYRPHYKQYRCRCWCYTVYC
jgi:hypothetical protein